MELYQSVDELYPYTFGESICKLRAFLIEFTSYASIMIICCFSVERWLVICYPLYVKLFSTFWRANIMIIFAWIVSFVAALPMAFIVKINRLPVPDFAVGQPWLSSVSDDGLTIVGSDFCAMDVTKPDRQKTLIYIAFFVFFMIPALLITIMYGHIALKLYSADKSLLHGKSSDSTKRSKSNKTVLKMLISVVVTFFLCWLPFHIQRLISVVLMADGAQNMSPVVHIVSMLVFYVSGFCYYSNSAINPILYNVLSQKYRKAFCNTILGENLTLRIFPSFVKKNAMNYRCVESSQKHSSYRKSPPPPLVMSDRHSESAPSDV